jgi:hypothetical protein
VIGIGIAVICNATTPLILRTLRYQLKLNLADESVDIVSHVLGVAPEAKLVHSFGRARTFMLPKGSVELSTLFQTLEQNRDRWGVLDYGLNQVCTLVGG